MDLNSVKVRVGSRLALRGGQLMKVTKVIRHPKYEVEQPPHADIAMLKLEYELKIDKKVRLIRIYDGKDEPFAENFVTVGGWGATTGSYGAFDVPPKGLKTALLRVRTREYCSEIYQFIEGLRNSEDLFCASFVHGISNTCLFDSGDPAVQDDSLVGVMSYGPESCGAKHPPAVFIKAYYFRDFVKSITSKSDIPEYWIEGKTNRHNGTMLQKKKKFKLATIER